MIELEKAMYYGAKPETFAAAKKVPPGGFRGGFPAMLAGLNKKSGGGAEV